MKPTLGILCIGDVFGEPGRRALATWVPRLRAELELGLVVRHRLVGCPGVRVRPPGVR